MTQPTESLFDRARKVTPADVAREHGVKLYKSGRKRSRGACPICESGDAFIADEDGPIWHCFSCGETGDAVALEMELGGHGDRVAAARVLAGEADRVRQERPRRQRVEAPAEVVDSRIVADHIVQHMVPAPGTIVEAWLHSRGIDVSRVAGAIDRLYFLSRCPAAAWRVDRDAAAVIHAPAMIAPLRVSAYGPIVGVHATYLSRDGKRKAAFGSLPNGKARPSRKMWGQARHAACFLGEMDGLGAPVTIAGEGVETVLSYAADLPMASTPLALLSLDNLQGRAMRDAEGVVPLWNLRSDPESPPFTLPGAGEVHLLIDADMRPVSMRCQLIRRGKRDRVRIDGLKRSEICATLATQAWRRAGAAPVRCYRAPAGMDFNDLGRAA